MTTVSPTRTRLPTNSTWRRRHRSSSTPAHGPTIVNGSSSTANAVATPAAVLGVLRREEEQRRQPDLEHAVGRLAHEPDGEQRAEVPQRSSHRTSQVGDHLHRAAALRTRRADASRGAGGTTKGAHRGPGCAGPSVRRISGVVLRSATGGCAVARSTLRCTPDQRSISPRMKASSCARPFVVLHLHRRGLHEVRRRREDRAADAAVLGDLRGADGVDDDAGRVGRVPDLELVLEVQGHLAERATLEADVGPLAVVEPRRRSPTGRCGRCGPPSCRRAGRRRGWR